MNRCTSILACVALLTAWAMGPSALARDEDSDAAILQGELGERLDRAVQAGGGSEFWGAVLVARAGEILLAKGYGMADDKEQPNTPRTLFELASASKQVAAAAILHLQQRRKLSVTDTLDRFFKNVPKDKKKIQVHHLLTHTSGISGRIGVPYASPLERKPYVKEMLAKPLIAEPGGKFEYCNVGYALLAAIVEEASGTTFEKYVEKFLFKPAGMRDSGFIGDRDLIKSDRVSVRKSGQGRQGTAADWHWGWGYRGMGGVVTTVLDLLRWDQALRRNDVLNEKSKTAMHTPFKGGYAYGWRVDVTDRGTKKAHHSGGVAGYGTNIVRYLEDDTCIFVLSNSGQSAHGVTESVEKLLFAPVAIEATIDVKPYDRPANRIYKLPTSLSWKTVKSRRHLVLQLRDKRHVVLEVRAPKIMTAGLISSLQQAIAAREADDDGSDAAFEAGLYLQAFDLSQRRIDLTEQLRIQIRSEYRGRGVGGEPVVDRRVLFYLDDTMHRCWPVMVKMNVAAARGLLMEMQRMVK